MTTNIIPDKPPSADVINRITANLIADIGQLLEAAAAEAANEWAESANIEAANIIMEDRIKDILATNLSGFTQKVTPRGHQFTDAHAAAYLGLKPTAKAKP